MCSVLVCCMETKTADELEGLTLVQNSQDVQATLEHIGVTEEYDALLVDSAQGEYTEVWGCHKVTVRQGTVFYNLLE